MLVKICKGMVLFQLQAQSIPYPKPILSPFAMQLGCRLHLQLQGFLLPDKQSATTSMEVCGIIQVQFWLHLLSFSTVMVARVPRLA